MRELNGGRKGWKIMTEDGESLDSNALRAVVGMIKEIEYQVAWGGDVLCPMRFYIRKVPNFVLGKLTRSISAESQILSNLTFDIVQGLAVPERITIRVP